MPSRKATASGGCGSPANTIDLKMAICRWCTAFCVFALARARILTAAPRGSVAASSSPQLTLPAVMMMGRSAVSMRSSSLALEVEPRNDLHQPSARVLCIGRILVGRRHLHEARVGRGDEGIAGGVEEVDIVEGVQELAAQFKIETLGKPDLLLEAQIEAGELRPGHKNVLRCALAAINLDAIRVAGGRDVASGGRSTRAITCRASGADIECADGI